MPTRPSILTLTLFLAPLAFAVPLFAAGGGGGGGGGSTPSESAPQYDPAEEYRKGMAAMQAKDFKSAKRAFDRVIAVAPKDANTQYLAGLSRTSLGDYKGAKKFLEKAVKLDPNLIGAQRELGMAYAKLGNKPKAEGTLTALQTRATSCGTTCPQAGELKAAVDDITAALNGSMKTSLRADEKLIFASAAKGDHQYLDAVALINEKRYDDAIATLKASQASFGPHPDVLTYLGFANRKMGRFDVAEGYYRQALAAAPHHRGATEYYGELMVERGDLPGARKMLAKLDDQCRFGCAEADELRRWIIAGRAPQS
jgi:tetratricopeptide (TPR) repeat protein